MSAEYHRRICDATDDREHGHLGLAEGEVAVLEEAGGEERVPALPRTIAVSHKGAQITSGLVEV